MVILSAALVNSCKTLLARQFVEMTRFRVEGLLSAFPRLIEAGSDHTFVETETLRYVYQPMEALYLVILTNKTSNIFEDLETLRLLANVVRDTCPIQLNEEIILKHAFDIVFAFDEVVSLGYRESVTLSQVRTYIKMRSETETWSPRIITQAQLDRVSELAKKKAMELDTVARKKQTELEKLPALHPQASSCGSDSTSMSSPPSFQEFMSICNKPGFASIDNSLSASSSNIMMDWKMDDSGTAPIKPAAPKKGMVLTKAKAETMPEPAAPAVVNPLLDQVKVEINMHVQARLEVEGDLAGEAECSGDFRITVLDTRADLVCFKLTPQDQSFKYKVHPNLNKQSHSNNILEVRDETRKYKVGTPVPLLKWRCVSTNQDILPISLSCWPLQKCDGVEIVLEYELTDMDIVLENVNIVFPCPPDARPAVSSSTSGEASYDVGTQQVRWAIPRIDVHEGNSGTLEFTAATDADALLPYQFTAVRRNTIGYPMEILECYHQADKSNIKYQLEKTYSYVLTAGR